MLEAEHVALRMPRQVGDRSQARGLLEHEVTILQACRPNADCHHVCSACGGVSISIRHALSPTGARCAGRQLARGLKGDLHRYCSAQNTPPWATMRTWLAVLRARLAASATRLRTSGNGSMPATALSSRQAETQE